MKKILIFSSLLFLCTFSYGQKEVKGDTLVATISPATDECCGNLCIATIDVTSYCEDGATLAVTNAQGLTQEVISFTLQLPDGSVTTITGNQLPPFLEEGDYTITTYETEGTGCAPSPLDFSLECCDICPEGYVVGYADGSIIAYIEEGGVRYPIKGTASTDDFQDVIVPLNDEGVADIELSDMGTVCFIPMTPCETECAKVCLTFPVPESLEMNISKTVSAESWEIGGTYVYELCVTNPRNEPTKFSLFDDRPTCMEGSPDNPDNPLTVVLEVGETYCSEVEYTTTKACEPGTTLTNVLNVTAFDSEGNEETVSVDLPHDSCSDEWCWAGVDNNIAIGAASNITAPITVITDNGGFETNFQTPIASATRTWDVFISTCSTEEVNAGTIPNTALVGYIDRLNFWGDEFTDIVNASIGANMVFDNFTTDATYARHFFMRLPCDCDCKINIRIVSSLGDEGLMPIVFDSTPNIDCTPVPASEFCN